MDSVCEKLQLWLIGSLFLRKIEFVLVFVPFPLREIFGLGAAVATLCLGRLISVLNLFCGLLVRLHRFLIIFAFRRS